MISMNSTINILNYRGKDTTQKVGRLSQKALYIQLIN